MAPGHGAEFGGTQASQRSALSGEFTTLNIHERQISSSYELWLEDMNLHWILQWLYIFGNLAQKFPFDKKETPKIKILSDKIQIQGNTHAKFYVLLLIIEKGLWCIILAQQNSCKFWSTWYRFLLKYKNVLITYYSITSIYLSYLLTQIFILWPQVLSGILCIS